MRALTFPLIAAAALAVAAASACTTTRGTTPTGEVTGWVRDIRLDNVRGEVGRPFQSRLTWRSNYIAEADAEVDVSGLPPGLRFDRAKLSIVGTPTQAGFFKVNVAVRKPPPPEPAHRPTPDERWWPATFEFEIYTPIKE